MSQDATTSTESPAIVRTPLELSDKETQGHALEKETRVFGRRSCEQSMQSNHDVEGPKDLTIQQRPSEFRNLAAEIVCILVCSFGQFLFAAFNGQILVNQQVLVTTFGIPDSKTPWLIGSYFLANGVSVSICGSLVDLVPLKPLLLASFAWMTVWNFIGALTFRASYRWIMFHVVRTNQGLALGAMISGSISLLGKLYQPGIRKTRAFSLMACFPPIGFSIGALWGGALTGHYEWVFGSNAILNGIVLVAALFTLPSAHPVKIEGSSRELSLRDFDTVGATFLIIGNALILFGVTQGSSIHWTPYTYSLIIVGCVFLVFFFISEKYAPRPLIAPQLWNTKGFAPLILCFGLSIGSWIGTWQPYAVQLFLFVQHHTPLHTALYFIPTAIVGVLAVYVVQNTMHRFSNQWLFSISMLANALSPALFLPISTKTSYWALAMPGIALGTFGPDMSFVAASIFITSSVPKSYQGAAGSLLITVENLAPAVFVAVGGAIGTAVNSADENPDGAEGYSSQPSIRLKGLRAIWWFGMSVSIFAALVTAATVRIRKAEEKEHVAEDM